MLPFAHTHTYRFTNLDTLTHADHTHGFVPSSQPKKAREGVHFAEIQ